MKINIPKKYSVRSIDNEQCKEWIIYKHYAKRIPPIEYAFGLFNDFNILSGIVTYSTPISTHLRSCFGNRYKLMELNRLVINEGLGKNVLSFFVSQSLKMLPKPLVIVSYSDTAQNHNGYIYQATNFIYTGLSLPKKDYYVEGMEKLHNGTIMDMSRGKDNRVEWLKEKFGDKLYMKERDRKHRYFFFLGNKRDKKEMMSILPYEIKSYPKGENQRYNASYQPTVQIPLF